MKYNLRQGTAQDIDILDVIYTENMKRYVEKVYPWNPQLFRNGFVPQDYQVLEINHQIIGFMKVVPSKTEIYLAEIQIIKDYQKKGIGTRLIQSIMQQAQANNKILWLKVIKGNPAKKLYERLGFTEVRKSLHHAIMVKQPENQAYM